MKGPHMLLHPPGLGSSPPGCSRKEGGKTAKQPDCPTQQAPNLKLPQTPQKWEGCRELLQVSKEKAGPE